MSILNTPVSDANQRDFPMLTGQGEMAQLLRAGDWSNTPLGPLHSWPQSLRTTLSIVLNSKFPMFLFWGPELLCFYNDAYRPSLGNEGKHPRALGKPGSQVWPEIWPVIKPLIDQVLAGGEATWSENQLIPIYRNGHLEDVYWTFSYSAVQDESGQIAGVFVTCNETTQQVISLQLLAESKDELQFALQAAELATWDYNPLTNRFQGNAQLKKWFGLAASEEIDLSVAVGAIIEQDRLRVQEAIAWALQSESGGLYAIEYTIRHPLTQSERIVKAKGRAWFDAHHIAYRLNGTLQDVTQEVIAQKRLVESEERFRTLADYMPNLAWMANADGWIFWYNRRWYDYTGTTPQQMEGWGWQSVHDPIKLEEVMEEWTRCIATGQPFEMVFPLRGANGTFRPFLTRVVPVYESKGQLAHWFGTNTDIYEQQLTQQQLQNLNEELATTTEELAAANEEIQANNEDLAETNRQLIHKNVDLDNFIYAASHDLKAPISNIEGLLQALLRTLPPESLASGRAGRITSLMQESVERFKKTIAILTDVVKLQKQHQTEAVSVDLRGVIQEVMLDLEPQIAAAGAQIATDMPGDPTFRFSENNLRSVVYNLLSNALKYRSSERVCQVCLAYRHTLEFHVLSVSDNGLGLEPGRLSQLFTMFKRFHNHVEGAGIGLYMIKKMVENAGGSIEVESKVGVGSTFRVYFPIIGTAYDSVGLSDGA